MADARAARALAFAGNRDLGPAVQSGNATTGDDTMKRIPAAICLAAMLLPAAGAAACSHTPTPGTVTGRLMIDGGPIGPHGQQPRPHPILGTIKFTGGQDQVITIRTSRTGVFSGQLPAGRYSVSYRSPHFLAAGRDGTSHQTWSQPVSVTVTAGHTTKVTLTAYVP
jgi:hypothetical protein